MPFSNGLTSDDTVSGILQVQNDIYVTTDYHGVYKSLDGLNEWRAMNRGLPSGVDINCIVVGKGNLVIGTLKHGIYILNLMESNWEKPSKNINSVPVRALINISDKLIAGTDRGVYESTDQGDSWHHLYGKMQVLGLTELDNKLYAAAQNGALLSVNGGIDWKYIYTGDALHDIANDGEYIYSMTLGQNLLKTKNDGLTWESAQREI